MPLSIKTLAEQAVAAGRFNGRLLVAAVADELGSDPALAAPWRQVEGALGADALRALGTLIRNCFLLEPVNPTATSTKFAVRWATDLPHPPTFAPFDECDAAFERLTREMADLDAASIELVTLRRFLRSRVLPYEAPIDYRARRLEAIHRDDNLEWIWNDPEIVETITLRELLRDPGVAGGEARAINLALDKIVVKTYLTDRALTGAHRTNREKRWETHPESVQFALRRDCGLDNLTNNLSRQFASFNAIVNHALDLSRDGFEAITISRNGNENIPNPVPETVDDVLCEGQGADLRLHGCARKHCKKEVRIKRCCVVNAELEKVALDNDLLIVASDHGAGTDQIRSVTDHQDVARADILFRS